MPSVDRKCGGCGAQISPDAIICVKCGLDLQARKEVETSLEPESKLARPQKEGRVCPQCGHVLRAQGDICVYCGANCAEVKRQPMPQALGSFEETEAEHPGRGRLSRYYDLLATPAPTGWRILRGLGILLYVFLMDFLMTSVAQICFPHVFPRLMASIQAAVALALVIGALLLLRLASQRTRLAMAQPERSYDGVFIVILLAGIAAWAWLASHTLMWIATLAVVITHIGGLYVLRNIRIFLWRNYLVAGFCMGLAMAAMQVPALTQARSIAEKIIAEKRLIAEKEIAEKKLIAEKEIAEKKLIAQMRTMVPIPAGKFRMGSRIEGSQHDVWVDAFYIGKYEVAQLDYGMVEGLHPSWSFSSPNSPELRVSWYDAVKYCNKRSRMEGLEPCYNEDTWACDFAKNGYRLPTEAEWEYACRAGSSSRWCFGNNERALGAYAWYSGNSENKRHNIGQKRPNAFGLYDMHGNAAEWCNDWYGDDYYENSPYKNPRGPERGSARVKRGGCWLYGADEMTSSTRSLESPKYRKRTIGFRCARTP